MKRRPTTTQNDRYARHEEERRRREEELLRLQREDQMREEEANRRREEERRSVLELNRAAASRRNRNVAGGPSRPQNHTGYAYGEGKRMAALAQERNSRGVPRNAFDDPRKHVPDCHPESEGESESDYYSDPSSYQDEEDTGGGQPAPAHQENGKDEIIHFNWQKGMLLNSRYELVKALGDGTFGRVLLAYDRCEDRQVAIKVIRDVKRYMQNAKIEAKILADIKRTDIRRKSRCAIMHETFTHNSNFFCLVFEPLGASLYDFLRKNVFRGFWVQDLQTMARQCMKALKFLHATLRMTHTDLKPENILLQSQEAPRPSRFPREAEWLQTQSSKTQQQLGQYLRPANAEIKLIDFGNATYEEEHHSSIINTRQYRGPEVVLELGWNESSDIWSMGCIIMELYTGELLLGTHENMEHLALMEQIVAPLPNAILKDAPNDIKQKYLHQDHRTGNWHIKWPENASSQQSFNHVRESRPLRQLVLAQHAPLVSLVQKMLKPQPADRLSASEVLKHAFFKSEFED